jgi:hypothetical protein
MNLVQIAGHYNESTVRISTEDFHGESLSEQLVSGHCLWYRGQLEGLILASSVEPHPFWLGHSLLIS